MLAVSPWWCSGYVDVHYTSHVAGSSPTYYLQFFSVFCLLSFTTLRYKSPIICMYFELRWRSDLGVSIPITTERKKEVMPRSLPHSPTCSQKQDSDACWGGYNLGKIKWNGEPPSLLSKSKIKPGKSQKAPFSRPWCGGINFPSILSKIVVAVIDRREIFAAIHYLHYYSPRF